MKKTSELAGTSFQGVIEATLTQMVSIFGKPTIMTDGKTVYQWGLDFDGIIVSIYDYKREGKLGKDEEYQWHIGGFDNAAVEVVEHAFYSVR